MKLKLFSIGFLMFISIFGLSQSTHNLLLDGDKMYKKEQFDLAEEKYRKAKANDKTGKAAYNLGNTLSAQERYEEAANQYSNAAEMSTNPEVKSKALYNLGNTHFQNEKFKESIEAYKGALTADNKNELAKENLMMAKMMLKQQEQQQQQQQQQEQQDQNQEENQEENQDQQQQQQQQEQEQKQEESQQQQESEKKDLDKEDARKLLEIIDNEEKKVQEKLRKMKGNTKKPKKDW